MEIPGCPTRNTIPYNVKNIDGYRSFKLGLEELELGRS